MQQLLSVWVSLDMRKRIIVVGASVLMFVAIIGMSRVVNSAPMTLLYSGLDSSSAGDVVQALDASNVKYEIRGNSIFVEGGRRDELRMTLASDGLPANSLNGYELLDTLTGFGTTSQMFDAAYWRAKEGELARTIVSSPQIKSARVHIANPSSQPFKRQIAATASVTVSTNGGALDSAQANALRYLVASAVAGLSAENVSVIDGRNGTLISGDDSRTGGGSSDREETLRMSVQRLLEARVGAGGAVVEVSIESETDHESIVETIFDPEGRVAISSEVEESTNSSTDSRNGTVTVASNLPDGEGAGSGDASANNSETRERINYEVSETRREFQRGPGAIKRITVAVLVDGIRTIDPETQAETWGPRSPEELASLEQLVASTVGFDEARGDVITLKTLEFQPVESVGTFAEPSFLSLQSIDAMSLIQTAVLALVSIILGLFVLRPILATANGKAPNLESNLITTQDTDNVPALPVPDLPNMASTLPALDGEVGGADFELPTLGVMSDFDFDDSDSDSSGDPVVRLKKLIEDRQDETIEILRGWMETKEENA